VVAPPSSSPPAAGVTLASTLPRLGVNLVMLTGILALLVNTSWRLALWVLVPVPLILLVATLAWDPLKRALERQAAHWASLSAHVVESLAGIRVVKAFTQEPREAERFEEGNGRVLAATVTAERTSFVLFSLIYVLMNFGVFLAWYVVLAWYVGGREVLAGRLPLGVLLAVIAYLWMFYWPLQWLGQVAGSAGQAVIGAERVFEILDTPVEDPAAGAQLIPPHLIAISGHVTFRNVRFAYDPGHPVLDGIEFEVLPGEMVGIVGRSGAGKTTLMNLLCRFYEVDGGTISIDGRDIRTLPLEYLREQIGVVAQDPFLFAGTILENIRFGRPTASIPDVLAAARAANAHPFIVAKPEAYDTEIGEGGHRLSGGEKQRLAIARAILKNAPILILDEATSQLDAESEAAIQAAIGMLTRHRTTFVIAHRLTTIRRADRILVLDQGQIAESGSHAALMARAALYARFVKTQRDMRSVLSSP
jgi:ATP-binding cassette subfamily B protein